MIKGGFIYIMTNRPNGVLYTGVTANLLARAYQHQTGTGGHFTSRYNLKRLVYYEYLPDIAEAIRREKTIKKWRRSWKTQLIETVNPDWADLYEQLNG